MLSYRFFTSIVASVFIFATLANSLIIECNFRHKTWENIGISYTCDVENLHVTTPNQKVTGIKGDHLQGQGNDDVEKLNIDSQTCEFLPIRLEKFFPNLQGLRVASSGLLSLRSTDLSVFPKLRNCDMFSNQLIVLEKDLFAKNPLLEYLYFGFNKIEKVDPNILDSLDNLKKVVFQDNRCIEINAYEPEYIENLKLGLKVYCTELSKEATVLQDLIYEKERRNKIEDDVNDDSTERDDNERGAMNISIWVVALIALIAASVAVVYLLKRRRAGQYKSRRFVAPDDELQYGQDLERSPYSNATAVPSTN